MFPLVSTTYDPEQRLWYGPKRKDLHSENMTLGEVICHQLKKQPNKIIQIHDGTGATNIRELLKLNKEETEDDTDFSYPCFDLHGDDTALIVFSSGTTGPAKGVLCSHGSLLSQEYAPNFTTESILFGFSPMYWISGIWALTTSLLHTCCRIITENEFSTEYFLDLVEKQKITHILMNASHVAEVALLENIPKVQEKLKSVVVFLAGGSIIPPVVHERMERILPNTRERPGFMVAYGMSELAGLVSMNGITSRQRRMGTVGQLVANRIVRLIDDSGKSLGPNEFGEICVNMQHCNWKGYFKNEQATKHVLVDNWLYTGDIGHFDTEGFLHFCTRGNDVFKSRNFQIYPQILEGLIAKLPGVFNVCVVGIPDIVATHLTAAAIVRTSDREGQCLTAKAIYDHVSGNIAAMYHLHGGIYFFESLPKTSTGKMLRKHVLEMVVKKSSKESNNFKEIN
ncbi:uncharacterized protein [Musca autumnalis]|uniref:uncharacterized protein n=1 Tax=Musca autumnalis TaxID=221902 RepID=UPI003CE971B4